MRSLLRITPAVALGLAITLLSPYSNVNAETRRGQPESEEPKRPEIRLSREGHIDVNADQRALMWYVSDPSGLAEVEARVVKIDSGTLEPAELYRSEKPEGRIDLEELGKGPGLYAILVKATNNEKVENEAGLRLSYAEVNPDCPTAKAWWPKLEATRGSAPSSASLETAYNPYQHNLLEMSRRAGYVVTGRVGELIACPTKTGELFTFVQFTDVKTLQKEGGPKAGDAPEEIVLRVPGGMAHGRVEIVSDAPVFRIGDEVLLFLTRDPQQQVPIVQGTFGVMLLDEGERIRSYDGSPVTGVRKDFTVQLDPSYRLDPKWVRHWDPNMRAVWKSPPEQEPIGELYKEEIKRGEPIALEEFLEQLDRAWATADKVGRLPVELNKSPRRPYREIPSERGKQGG